MSPSSASLIASRYRVACFTFFDQISATPRGCGTAKFHYEHVGDQKAMPGVTVPT